MKKLMTAIAICGLLAAPMANVQAEKEKPFFDLENCDMCKNMSAEKGLMDNMQWENHAIGNGLMSVTVVAAGFEEAYERSQKKMQATRESMMKGAKVELCGFCNSFGALMMAGAKMENVVTNAGHVMLVTSDDAEVVKQIHAHVERTNAEYEKMLGSHAGHNHDDHGSSH